MSPRYLEDYTAGELIISQPFKLSRLNLLSFAQFYDAQPIHIDEKFASKSGPFDDIIASGFQTVAIAFKLFIDLGFCGGDVALGGPGMDSVRWLSPVFPGNTLTNYINVAKIRKSNSKPDRGILSLNHVLKNQNNVTVLTFTTASMIRCRETRS